MELTFRRIANRIRKIKRSGLSVSALLAIGVVTLLAGTTSARAANPVDDPPNEVIEQVLAHEDFTIHKRTEKVPVARDSGDFSGLSFLGALGHLLFWVVVAALVAGIVVLIYKNRHYFAFRGSGSRDAVAEPRARTILGMEIGAESLPDDVVAAARRAWQEGEKQAALSLLYRGAVSWLVESARAPIRESDTESDCLRRAQSIEAARDKLGYLESLTGTWIGLAYGRSEPADEEMEQLLQSWPFNLGVSKS